MSSSTSTATKAAAAKAEPAAKAETNGVAEPQDGVVFHTIRGKTYRIEELTAKEYEDAQRKAEISDKDNEGATVTDMILLEKLVTLKAVTVVDKAGDAAGEKLDPDEWSKEKYPVTSRVGLEVRRAHYMSLTDDEKARTKTDPNA